MIQRLLKGTFLLSFSRILSIASALVSNKLLVLMLSKGDVGTYQQILTVVGMDVFILFGLPDAIVYFFSGKATDRGDSIKKTVYLLLLIASVLSFVSVLFGKGLIAAYFGNPDIAEFPIQIAVLFSTSIIGTCFPSICIAYDKTPSTVIVSTLNALSRVIIFGVGYLTESNLRSLLSYLSIASIVFLVIQLILVYHLEKNNRGVINVKENIGTILAYSLPLFLTIIIGKLTVLTDKLMIGWFFSTEVYAVYSVAARELPYTIVTAAFISVATPTIFTMIKESNWDGAIKLWRNGVRYSLIFIIFAIATNIVMADDLIRFLYSESYLSSQLVFTIYLFALLPRVAYWGIFAKATNKNRYILLTSIVELSLNIILNFILINVVGLVGAAIATVASSYICVVLWIFINIRITGRSFTLFFPVAELIKALIINGSLSIVFLLLRRNLLDRLIASPFFRLATVAVLWGGIVFVIYSKDIKRALIGWKHSEGIK